MNLISTEFMKHYSIINEKKDQPGQPVYKTCYMFLLAVCLFTGCATTGNVRSQQVVYHNINEFSTKVNTRFKSFLMNSQSENKRKVAVFDCDGTLIGQVPHYLADEALFEYADRHYKGKDDSLSHAKMNIIHHMLDGNNVGNQYIENRIHFFAGLPADSVEQWGTQVYRSHFRHKFYPGMRGVVSNLREFGFEIWVITASPELIYQQFVSDELGIPENRIIGVKSTIRNGIISNQIIHPVPQDEGKGHTIATFIKAKPLFVAGNSMGDVDMIGESTGLKWIVNPDDHNRQQALGGATLKDYAAHHGWETVYCPDRPDSSLRFVSDDWNIPVNEIVNP